MTTPAVDQSALAIAREAGCTVAQLRRWLAADPIPPAKLIRRLAAAYNMKPGRFVDEILAAALAARGERLSGLKTTRLAWGLSAGEMAERLGVERARYVHLEQGELPQADGYIWAWCLRLGMPAEELIPLIERKPAARFQLAALIAERRDVEGVLLTRGEATELFMLCEFREGTAMLRSTELAIVARHLRMSVDQLKATIAR